MELKEDCHTCTNSFTALLYVALCESPFVFPCTENSTNKMGMKINALGALQSSWAHNGPLDCYGEPAPIILYA